MHNSSQTEPSPAPQDTSQGFAHAKAILFGEHAVVYGSPAVAVPLHGLGVQADIRRSPHQETRIESQLFSGTAQTAPEPMDPVVAGLNAALKAVGDPDAEVELLIRSAIPHSRGLGSSAAVATSVARAVANLHATVFDENTLHEIVQAAETVAHGRPSGIDAWAVAKPAPSASRPGARRPSTSVSASSSSSRTPVITGPPPRRSEGSVPAVTPIPPASGDDRPSGSAHRRRRRRHPLR